MLFMREKTVQHSGLAGECRLLLHRIKEGDTKARLNPESFSGQQDREAAQAINEALDQFRKEAEDARIRLDLVKDAIKVGLWEMHVVADEVRKLATNSAEATNNIEASLNQMKELIDQILEHIANMSSMTETQAALTEELNASIEEINSMAQSLANYAKSI